MIYPVAVIGASGFTGRHLAHTALMQGYSVCCLGRTRPTGMRDGEWQLYDLASLVGTIPIPAGTDAVFYLAQSAHYQDFPRYAEDPFAINAQGVARAALAACQAGVRFFCHASSVNVYSPSFATLTEQAHLEPHTPYAASKLMGERRQLASEGRCTF